MRDALGGGIAYSLTKTYGLVVIVPRNSPLQYKCRSSKSKAWNQSRACVPVPDACGYFPIEHHKRCGNLAKVNERLAHNKVAFDGNDNAFEMGNRRRQDSPEAVLMLQPGAVAWRVTS